MEIEAKNALEIHRDQKEFIIIDVRTSKEFAEGHLKGAVNIDFNSPGFENAVRKLDRRKKYIIYCLSGIRGSKAAGIMENLGFTACMNVTGGLKELKSCGARLVKQQEFH